MGVGRKRSRIKVVQMNNLRAIIRIKRVKNERIRILMKSIDHLSMYPSVSVEFKPP